MPPAKTCRARVELCRGSLESSLLSVETIAEERINVLGDEFETKGHPQRNETKGHPQSASQTTWGFSSFPELTSKRGQPQLKRQRCLNTLRIQGFLPDLRITGTLNHQRRAGESRSKKSVFIRSATEQSSRPARPKRPASSAGRVPPPLPSGSRPSQWHGNTLIQFL